MNIGGHDIHFEHKMTTRDVITMLQMATAMWPDGVYEHADGSGVLPAMIKTVALVGFAVPCGFFIYENESARVSWSKDGRTEDNDGKMIGITVDAGGADFVVNHAESVTARWVLSVTNAIAINHRHEGRR